MHQNLNGAPSRDPLNLKDPLQLDRHLKLFQISSEETH